MPTPKHNPITTYSKANKKRIRAMRLHNAGLSAPQIVRLLGWSRASVFQYLAGR